MAYECKRCGKDFPQLSNLKRHLGRVTPCENSLNCNKTCEQLLSEITIDRSDFEFACEHCEKRFEFKRNLTQHYLYCKKKKEADNKSTSDSIKREVDKEIGSLKKEIIDELKSITPTQNITINVNNVNIMINNFGSEDISHVINDKAFLDRCIQSIKHGLPLVIEKIYYDKDKPENHNVFMKSAKNKTGIVLKEGVWKQEHLNQIVPNMVKKGTTVLSSHLETKRVDPDHEWHGAFVKKEEYLNSIVSQKKPEYYELTSAVSAIIGNHKRT